MNRTDRLENEVFQLKQQLSLLEAKTAERLKELATTLKTLAAGGQQMSAALLEFIEGQKKREALLDMTLSDVTERLEVLEGEVKTLKENVQTLAYPDSL